MVVAAALLLAQAPLSLPAGFRTFPEIAALVGSSPKEVRCDPRIAHRAAFVRAKAISREGLLRTLELKVVPDGGGRGILKDARERPEREWAASVRRALERQYVRSRDAMIARADAKIPNDPRFAPNWVEARIEIANDPDADPAARERVNQELAERSRDRIVASDDGEARVRALAAFPATIPLELQERGQFVDTVPLGSLPPRALAGFRREYPELRGGPGAIAVRVRTMFGTSIRVKIGLVDPARVLPPEWAMVANLFDMRNPSLVASLVRTDADGTIKLRTFAQEMALQRAQEAEGLALANAYTESVPPPEKPLFASLSTVAQGWAEAGRDVVMELDPETEGLNEAMDGTRLRRDGDWSPRVVEGVLALRPLARFLTATRRYPYAALFALEAAGVRSDRVTLYGETYPKDEILERYASLAGPLDRWNGVQYRGWGVYGFDIDRLAAMQRTRRFVPAWILVESAARLEELRAKQSPAQRSGALRDVAPEAARWTVPLAGLSPETKRAIVAELRADSQGTSILAHSPEATELYLRETAFQVTLGDTLAGYRRSIVAHADRVPMFGWTLGSN